MKKYIGVKMVEAEPMVLAEAVNKGYYKDRGLISLTTPGYHVKYNDNHHSWSPKDVFESAHFGLETDGEIITKDIENFPGIKDCGVYKPSDGRSGGKTLIQSLWFVLLWAKKGLNKIK